VVIPSLDSFLSNNGSALDVSSGLSLVYHATTMIGDSNFSGFGIPSTGKTVGPIRLLRVTAFNITIPIVFTSVNTYGGLSALPSPISTHVSILSTII
jgi:hypothetical protein